jgi:hypothetical protein
VDRAALDLMEACHPHVPCALLAHLHRAGEPFPPNTERLAPGGFRHVLEAGGWEGDLIQAAQYIRFYCAACRSLMFQPNTHRGIAHALKVARSHKPDCCAERAVRYAESGVPAVWPDRLDELWRSYASTAHSAR